LSGDCRFVDRHGLVAGSAKHTAGYIDIIGDIVESANLIIQRPRTASVVLGGGTPKNLINQASVQAEFYSDEVGGTPTRCKS
jgi:deoxyhypusine synthase